MEQINFQKTEDDAENLKAKDGAPIFKFTSVGDRIVAKFVRRRRGIKDPATGECDRAPCRYSGQVS